MTTIAPVLFDAFPEDAPHCRETPYRPCFNAGAPSEATRILSTPYEDPRTWWAAVAMVAVGLLPLVGTVLLGFFIFLFFRGDTGGLSSQGWLAPVILSGIAMAAVGGIWAWYLQSRFHPKAKAWRKTLGEAWLTYGGQIFDLNRAPYAHRSEIVGYAQRLEAIREGLNRLAPEGDELDGARYTLQRYIEVSDIPLLGKRAADAPHIKDPAVRQAAKEYKQALKQQEYARQAAESEISQASDLLVTRQQARTDAEIIRLVHER
jgi:hypothetical protein